MITIKSLIDVSFEEITTVFNHSFSDYYLPVKFTKNKLIEKFESENGQLTLSVGAFKDHKLIGFILHFYGIIGNQKVIYNGGTGVIPNERGQGLTLKMYKYILPILNKMNIDKMIHEVLTINEPAIHLYKKVGFKMTRTLNCYKGKLSKEIKINHMTSEN